MKAYSEKQKFWAEHIKMQMNSGKTIKAYCQQHGLNRDQFAYYLLEIFGGSYQFSM